MLFDTFAHKVDGGLLHIFPEPQHTKLVSASLIAMLERLCGNVDSESEGIVAVKPRNIGNFFELVSLLLIVLISSQVNHLIFEIDGSLAEVD